MRHALLACFVLAGCPSPAVDSGDTDSLPETVDLEGVVTDPYQYDAAVDGAWVLLDLGDEQLALRTGSDGSFSMPGLPADQPVTITVAAEDHLAVTYDGVMLGEAEMPLELATHLRDLDSYATETTTITGVVSGAPVGSYVFLFGPTDEAITDSYLGYGLATVEDEPVTVEIEPQLVLPDDDYVVGVLAFDSDSWDVVAAGSATVSWGGEASFELELEPEAMHDLTVTTNRPLLDGQALGSVDPDLCHSLAIAHLGESMSTTTGYNRSCDEDDAGWILDVGWMPSDGYTDRLQLYLLTGDDFDAYAYGSVPIPEGAAELEVTLLDSPVPDHRDTVGQGDVISWQPVDGAGGTMLYGYDGDGSLAWYLYADEDASSITVPRFPVDFDPTIIVDGGSWAVISRTIVYAEDGSLEQSEDYLGSIAQGGGLDL